EILQRRRSYDALLAQLETTYPEYYQIKYRHPSLTVAGVQQALPVGTGLLEYFQGDQGTYAFYFDRTHALGLRLTTDSSFTGALNRLLDGLRDRNQVTEQGRSAVAIARFAKDAATAYRTLVAPTGEKMPEKLIIIPDGRLAYLPFELLLTQDAGSDEATDYKNLHYLIRQTTVRYEYSAGLALQPPLRRHPSRFFVGFAPMYGGDLSAATTRGERSDCRGVAATDFAPLGNNQTEVTQIAQLFDGQAFLAENATESQFRQHAKEPRIVHLAMHGFLNDCDPLYSGLVFSKQAAVGGNNHSADSSQKDSTAEQEDGFLHAYEIYNLHLNAELAVLSACNTGHGQLAKGEGVISLARAFKYAGCSNVLMSLWQADDQATAQIMQGFYQYLKEGKGKDEAIRQAKLDYIHSNARNHPFFWGAFVLIGDDLPMKQPSASWIWYGLVLLLASLGIAYWSIRQRANLGFSKNAR
ncbi:MAG TPA: CHAT domain-containing protein, partial [Saprospiraceae bacterium]|nr:CHAT domain-containing protein [Saprospiraceae bacterium]